MKSIKLRKIAGMTLLETLIAASIFSGIMLAASYAVHMFANATIHNEINVRRDFTAAETMVNMLDRDFAASDQVFVFAGGHWLNGSAIPWISGSSGPNPTVFDLDFSTLSDSADLTNPLDSTDYSSILTTAGYTYTPDPGFWEVHFVTKSAIRAVLLVDRNSSNITYRRLTPSEGVSRQYQTSEAGYDAVVPAIAAGNNLVTLTLPNARMVNTANPSYSDTLSLIRCIR